MSTVSRLKIWIYGERLTSADLNAEIDNTNAGINAVSAASQPLDSDLTAIAALTTTSYGRAFLALADAAAARIAAGLILGTDIYSKSAVDAGFQPLDSDLTSIAALATTAYGRAFLALADASAARTAVGLVLGTDVYSKAAIDAGFQPLDSDLTAIAALSTTSFGRALLALADAAALRTAAGVTATGSDTAYNYRANNLSDVANAGTARTNLGLVAVAASGSAADLSTGTLPAGRLPALTGDVTTSAGAVATTIAAAAVTYAKMQNITAQYRLLGRSSSGAGSPEEIASSANVFTMLGSANNAAILSNIGAPASATTVSAAGLASGGGDLSANRTITVTAATDAQARAQTSTTTALTPSNLQARAAFAANKNGTDQTGIATGTYTKVTWGTENFDQGALFDSATNYRWTPSAGVVRISAQLYFSAGNTGTSLQCALYKNGTALKIGLGPAIGTAGVALVNYTDVANGTDYYEIFAYGTTATTLTVSGDVTLTYFSGGQG